MPVTEYKRFLVIGCGISGISFSMELEKAGMDFSVIDPCENNSSSFIAGALINPVSGRKNAQQWNIDILLEKASQFYRELSNKLGTSIFKEKNILKIHKSEDSKTEWGLQHANKFSEPFDTSAFNTILHCPYGGFEVNKALQIYPQELISAYTDYLSKKNILIRKYFQPEILKMSDGNFKYENEIYTNIVFCDGVQSLKNIFFSQTPFKPAKGECLIIKIPDLPQDHIYHKNIILIPLQDDVFWTGATNTWDDMTIQPTAEGKKELEFQLNQLIRLPYTIIDHLAAIRPTIRDRTPVVGSHPVYSNMHILNGMGSKGMSLAPYYAEILLQHILTDKPIPKEANVLRFAALNKE